ncbi:MAG: helix-turn-helix transcriptional regulator [Bacteroidaceae bacterium]|nr:helix-turn-helix transcriptional regulator [Bacteroidaceae bacterium]
MKLHTLDELTDKYIGKVGTPKRDAFERKLADELHAYHIGEAIKMARESQSLTQEQLGERMGVQRAQVCRIERGKSITFASMMRAFKAMGIQVALDMKGVGSVVL